MRLDGNVILAVVRKRYRGEDGVERFCAVAAFASYDDALLHAETQKEREGARGRYDIAPLTPPAENWTQ